VAPLSDLSKSQRVTAAAKPEQHCQEGQLAWAPSSKALAFFSNCAHSEQTDLYLSRLDGGVARRLTELKGYEEAPAFSPDGKSVAFLYVEGATRPAGALAAMKPWAGVIGEDGVEIQRIAVADVDASKPETPLMASPHDLHVYEFDWRPDSKGFAYVAADPPGENNWWVAKLYTQALGAQPEVVLAPDKVAGPLHGLQIAVPRWSPDGRKIALIGGLMSDQGATGGDVWLVAAEGGAPVNLTPGRQSSAAWIEWSGASALYVSELSGGNAQLIQLRLGGEEAGAQEASVHGPVYCIPADVEDGRLEMSLSATSDHALFVFRASSFDHPMEIYSAKTEMVTSACAGSGSPMTG
jgi:Tol biopolymer transport system component